MVVSFSKTKLFEIIINAFAHFMQRPKVHWRTLHLFFWSIWNGCAVGRQVIIRIDFQQVVADGRIACPRKVKIRVIGKV